MRELYSDNYGTSLPELVILRGLSLVGKSRYVSQLPNYKVISYDNFYMVDGHSYYPREDNVEECIRVLSSHYSDLTYRYKNMGLSTLLQTNINQLHNYVIGYTNKLYREYVELGNDIIIDNTNIELYEMRGFIDKVLDRYRIRIIDFGYLRYNGVFDLDEHMHRNYNRQCITGVFIPESVLKKQYRKYVNIGSNYSIDDILLSVAPWEKLLCERVED